MVRTFRVATSSAEVPGQSGDRVTLACAASDGGAVDGSSARGRRGLLPRLLPSRPPGTRAGEPLEVRSPPAAEPGIGQGSPWRRWFLTCSVTQCRDSFGSEHRFVCQQLTNHGSSRVAKLLRPPPPAGTGTDTWAKWLPTALVRSLLRPTGSHLGPIGLHLSQKQSKRQCARV